MNTPGTFQIHATDGAARTGVLQTAHGPVNTPIFMPVGTVGSVKAIAPDDLNAIGAEIILGNTYHLYLRPGDELVARRGGLHGFNAWDKPILTDSGGFQVIQPFHPADRIKEDGVHLPFPPRRLEVTSVHAGKSGKHPAQPQFRHHDGSSTSAWRHGADHTRGRRSP